MTTLHPAPGAVSDTAREALDLDVRVVGGTGSLRATVEVDAMGLAVTSPFVPPLSTADVEAFAAQLDAARRAGFPPPTAGDDVYTRTEALGRALFRSLFHDGALSVLARAEQHASASGAPLRIRLRLDDAPEVARLPWELLCQDQRFLVHTDDEYVVRCSDVLRPSTRPVLDGPLRVLVVAASPLDREPLAVQEEVAALEAELARVADRVHVHRLEPATREALTAALGERWHVLHVVGHGDVHPDGSASLSLEDDAGLADEVSDVTVGHLVAGAPHVRLAVLNGCRTAEVPVDRPHGGVAARLVRAGVPAAVAMQFPVTDTAGVAFARALYASLATGVPVERAVVAGRRALLSTPEWVTPVLFARTPGVLFEGARPVDPPAGRAVDADALARHVPPELVPPPPRLQERPWVVAEVARWLASQDRVLVLSGDAGMGKSVMCGWLAAAVGPAVRAPAVGGPDTSALEQVRAAWRAVHFCSATLVGGSTDPRSFVLALADQLAATVPGFAQPAASAPGGPGAPWVGALGVGDLFATAVEQPLRAALRRPGAAPVVVLVDGLEEADPLPPVTSLDLLGRLARLDPAVRLLVAAPNDEDLLRRALAGSTARRLDLAAPEHQAQVRADVASYVRAQLDGHPGGAGLVEEVITRAEGSFLYARNAVEEVLAAGPDETPDLTLPGSIDESYLHLLDRAERAWGQAWPEQWRSTVEPLLGVLAAAFAPVPRTALEAWLGLNPPRLNPVLDRLGGVVVADEHRLRLAHGSLAALLVRPGRYQVDVTAAHRTVAAAVAGLDDTALGRPETLGGSYALVHAPGHVAALREVADDGGLLDRLLARVRTATYVTALARCVEDPVALGHPYRVLSRALVSAGRTDDAVAVARFVATAPSGPVRASVYDVIDDVVRHDERLATDLLVTSALAEDPGERAIALHATSLLTPSAQAEAFRRIAVRGEEENLVAAAYALFANGSADPQGLIGAVLDAVVDGVSLRRPLELKPVLTFFTEITVTNYVHHCDRPEVVELTARLFHRLLVERLHAGNPLGRLADPLVERYMAARLGERVLASLVPRGQTHGGAGVPWADAARRVVPTLDPAAQLPATADLRELLAVPEALPRTLATLTVALHDVTDPDGTGPVVEELVRSTDATARHWVLLGHALVLPGTPDAWVPLLERCTRQVMVRDHDEERDDVLGDLHLTAVPLALAYAKAGLPFAVHEEVLAGGGDLPPAWRPCVLEALGVAGLRHPDAVLGVLGRLHDTGAWPLADAVPALALQSGLHPLRTRAWLLDRGERAVLTLVQERLDPLRTQRYLDLLGLYNNAVHQALRYPQMRERLCQGAFTTYLASRTRAEWLRRYTHVGLSMLREADFDLRRWTR